MSQVTSSTLWFLQLMSATNYALPQSLQCQSKLLAVGQATGQKTQKQTSKAQETQMFVWTKHWYPLLLESDLDTQNPTPHTLLNINMVVWKDGEGKWGACEDRCPHRSAAEQPFMPVLTHCLLVITCSPASWCLGCSRLVESQVMQL